MKNHPFYHRMGYALHGMRVVWRSEHSFRTECYIAIGAAVVTAALRPGWLWGALIALCAALVLALELLNTSLEYLMDHVHPDIAPAIKHAKDAAAAGVLITGVGAILVGIMMLISVATG